MRSYRQIHEPILKRLNRNELWVSTAAVNSQDFLRISVHRLSTTCAGAECTRCGAACPLGQSELLGGLVAVDVPLAAGQCRLQSPFTCWAILSGVEALQHFNRRVWEEASLTFFLCCAVSVCDYHHAPSAVCTQQT